MKTREEEIGKAAKEFISMFPFTGARSEDGAQWADEHPKNPWRNAQTDPPKNDEQIIVSFEGGIRRVGEYSPCEEVYRAYGFGVVVADYWMPIQELPKGGEL